MVDIEEVESDPIIEEDAENSDLPSQERLLDAVAIEQVAESIDRPTARLHLQGLAKKLRRESEALKRMEKHAHMTERNSFDENLAAESSSRSPSRPAAAVTPQPIAVAAPSLAPSKHYNTIDRFSIDFGGYNSAFLTLYVPLPGVGSIPKEQVICNYTKSSFDLIVNDLQGKSFRLFRENLEKNIDPDKCKVIIKSDEARIKLAKVAKKDYGGYDYWTKLTEAPDKKKKMENPSAGIMDLMKQMYDEGDDSMKKMIGETMMKQRTGELGKDMDLDDKYKL
jgi:calcyclin binding protein